MENPSKLSRSMQEGRVYRRQELAGITTSVDRDLKTLLTRGVVRKLAPGLYVRSKKNRFGVSPPSTEDLVKAFLKTDDFLINSYNNFTQLGLGLTQVYNQSMVYNHKRAGKFLLGGRKFEFRRVPAFPKSLSKEFLLVDLLNNLSRLPDNTEDVEKNLPSRLQEFDSAQLEESARKFGRPATQRMLKDLHG